MIHCGELVKYIGNSRILRIYICDLVYINVFCVHNPEYVICLEKYSVPGQKHWIKLL